MMTNNRNKSRIRTLLRDKMRILLKSKIMILLKSKMRISLKTIKKYKLRMLAGMEKDCTIIAKNKENPISRTKMKIRTIDRDNLNS